MSKKTYVKNAADPKQVKAAKEREKFSEDTQEKDLVGLLKLPGGRRFIWGLLEYCGIFESSFNHSGSITYFNEGKRQVGLKLLADITEFYPEAMVLMMNEHKEK